MRLGLNQPFFVQIARPVTSGVQLEKTTGEDDLCQEKVLLQKAATN